MIGSNKAADVFVIGGGPAGLAAAIAARKRAFTVTLADGCEPPIDKACGEGLMPGTLAALRDLNVHLPAGLGCRLRGIRFVEGHTQVAAQFPGGEGIGIRRVVLHELLIKKAQECGVELLWKTPVVGIESDGVRLKDEVVRARWVVGADGGQSRVRRWARLDSATVNGCRLANRRHYRVPPWSEFTEVYWGPRVQAYVTPISEAEICLVTMGETTEDADFDHTLSNLPELRGRLANAQLCNRERGAVSSIEALGRVSRGRVALVGDASGGVDAITGEGLRLAFRQAAAVAEAIEARDLRRYERAHRRLAGRPLWTGRLLLVLARYGKMRSKTMAMLSRNPDLFARLLEIHLGEATTPHVITTGTRLAWQYLAS